MTADVLPLRQPRERAVACTLCRRDTWNVSALCDRCTPTAARLQAVKAAHPAGKGRSVALVGEAILDAARAFDGWRTPEDFHNAVLVRVCTATAALDRILAAGLYAVAIDFGDTLQQALIRLCDAHLDLVTDVQQEHEGVPCRSTVDDACLDCRGLNQQACDAALDRVRVLLGDAVLADAAQVLA